MKFKKKIIYLSFYSVYQPYEDRKPADSRQLQTQILIVAIYIYIYIFFLNLFIYLFIYINIYKIFNNE